MTLSLQRRRRTITPRRDFKIRNGAKRVAWHVREEIPGVEQEEIGEVEQEEIGEVDNVDLVEVVDTIDSLYRSGDMGIHG